MGMDIDTETVGDGASLDPRQLQLPEVSAMALKKSPEIAEELYSEWLSLPETARLVVSPFLRATSFFKTTSVFEFRIYFVFKWTNLFNV